MMHERSRILRPSPFASAARMGALVAAVVLAGAAFAGAEKSQRAAVSADAKRAVVVDAPAPAPRELFVETPGEQEFTGRMIARIARGLAPVDRARASAELARVARGLRHEPRTDEHLLVVAEGPARPGVAENAVAAALLATGLFEYVSPDWMLFPTVVPNDPRFGEQWHHVMMQSAAAWDLHRADAATELIVAVTDTGIAGAHEDLQNRVPGYNAVSNTAESDGGVLADLNGHGTHVAGCAAAAGNNGVGVSGMGWNFRIMPIRVSEASNGGAYMSDLLEGASWAAENGAKVVSASYSGIGNPSIETTGAYIRSLDSSLLWAGGNSAVDHAGWDFDNVLVVGASDQADARASFSGFGRGVDLFAPGVSILSSVTNGTYGNASGTSMATPVANGALALIRSANPALSATHAEHVLMHSCDPWETEANGETFGWGRINLARAVERAQQAFVPQPPLARNDRVRALAGSAVEIDVLANDWDANMDALAIQSFSATTTAGSAVTLVPASAEGGRARLRIENTGALAGTQSFYYTLVEPASGAISTATAFVDTSIGRAPVTVVGKVAGLATAYYELTAPTVLPNFSTLTPYLTETVANLNYASTTDVFAGSGRIDNVGAVYTGWIEIPTSGFWTLSTRSDDGSKLWIGEDLVVSNDGVHGMQTRSGLRPLAAGLHPLRVEFFEGGGGAGLSMYWSGPGVSTATVPPERLFNGGAIERADLNGDGVINSQDLAILLGAWGSSNATADIDQDGVVGSTDLAQLLSRWTGA